MTYTDKNEKTLQNLDIIDIHQTVNGENRFIIASLEDKDVRYFHNPTLKYEYDVQDLLKPCSFSSEPSFTIIGTHAEEIPTIETEKSIEKITGYLVSVSIYENGATIEKITLTSQDKEFTNYTKKSSISGKFDFANYVNSIYDRKIEELKNEEREVIRLTEQEFNQIQNFKA